MITELTKEQNALLPVYRDKWLQIGLAAGKGDRAEAERGVRLAYQAADLTPPKYYVWLDSPLAGCYAGVMLDQVWDQVGDQVWAQVGDQVGDQVWAQVGDQVGDQVWAQVRNQVRDQVGDQVWNQVRNQVGDQVWDQVWNQVRDQVGDQVWNQVWAQVRDQVKDQVKDQIYKSIEGQHDSNWLGFCNFFADVLDISAAKKLEGLNLVAQNTGWWWAYENVAVLTDRPVALHRDPEHRLHNPKGMAVEYADGFGIWAINGVRVTEQIVIQPETLTVEQITGERNAEIRRVMRQQYGYDKYLAGVGAELIDDDCEWGKLWRAQIEGEDEPLCMVEVINSTPEPDGSSKTYFLRVPPDMPTAHDAVAWTFTDDQGEALTAETYQPLQQT